MIPTPLLDGASPKGRRPTARRIASGFVPLLAVLGAMGAASHPWLTASFLAGIVVALLLAPAVRRVGDTRFGSDDGTPAGGLDAPPAVQSRQR
jgi:hypothetical protein